MYVFNLLCFLVLFMFEDIVWVFRSVKLFGVSEWVLEELSLAGTSTFGDDDDVDEYVV